MWWQHMQRCLKLLENRVEMKWMPWLSLYSGFDLWTLCQACLAHPHRHNVKTRYLWLRGLSTQNKADLEQWRKKNKWHSHSRVNIISKLQWRFSFGQMWLKYCRKWMLMTSIGVWHSEHFGHELEQHEASLGFRWGEGGPFQCRLSGSKL